MKKGEKIVTEENIKTSYYYDRKFEDLRNRLEDAACIINLEYDKILEFSIILDSIFKSCSTKNEEDKVILHKCKAISDDFINKVLIELNKLETVTDGLDLNFANDIHIYGKMKLKGWGPYRF